MTNQKFSSDSIAPSSQVWVHPLLKKVGVEEKKTVLPILDKFVQSWTSHQDPAPGNYLLKYDQFVVLINSHSLGGCSIDSSYHVVDEIHRALNLINDRTPRLFYRNPTDNNNIHSIERYKVSSLVVAGTLTPQTIVFNPTVTNWQSFQNDWEVEAEKTWLTKYFTKQTS